MGVDAKIQQRLADRGLIGDDTFQRLNQQLATPDEVIEEEVVVDEAGRVPGTNVVPKDVVKPDRIDPMTQVSGAEKTTLTIDDQPQTQEFDTGTIAKVPGFEQYSAGFLMGQEALAKKGAAESQKANALLAQQQENDEQARQREVEMEEQRQQEDEYLRSQRGKIEAKQAEYDEKPANMAQLFSKKTTGGKVAMGLALFLGAAPNSSGQNKAVQVITDSIQQDLDKQMNEVDGQRGIFNDMKSEFADKEQARMAAYETTMRQLQRQLQIEGGKYDSPIIKANTEAGIAQLQGEIDKMKAGFDQAAAANMLKQQELGQKERELMVPGFGTAPNKKVRDEMFEISGSVAEANAIVDDLLNQAKTGSVFSMEDRAKAAMNVNSLVGKMRIAVVGPGPLTETEREFIKGMIGNPLKTIGLKKLEVAKLTELKRVMSKSLNAKAKAFGMQPEANTSDLSRFKD